MAGTFSNVVTKPSPVPFTGAASTSPFSTALSNIASGNRTSTSSTIQPSTPLKSITTNNIDGSSTKHEFHADNSSSSSGQGIPKSQVDAFTSAYKAQQPQQGLLSGYQTGGNPNASPNLVGTTPTTGGLTSSGNYPTVDSSGNFQTSKPTTAPINNSFGGLVGSSAQGYNQAAQVGQEAGQLRQAMARETQDVLGNPYYSGAVKLGQAGIIQQNQGTQLNALANEQQALQSGAAGYNSLAGTVAPRQNGYVLIDTTTGQPVGGQEGLNAAINAGAQADAAYSGALGNATDNQAISGAQNNVDSLTQLIQNSPELNKSGVNLQNAGYAILQKNLSSSDRATLENTLSTINATLSKVTGSPVDIGQLSNSQGTSIVTTINNALASAKGIAAGKLSGSQSSVSGGSFKDGQTSSDGSLVYKGGKWQVK